MLKQSLNNGSLYITEDVLCIITSICVQESEGIEITKVGIKDEIFLKFSSNYYKKGVSISHTSEDIEIEVRVVAHFGINLLDTCYELQKSICEDIKEITGIHVSNVRIIVEHIIMN